MGCYTTYKRRNQVELICKFCGVKKLVSAARAKECSHCSRQCYIKDAHAVGQRECKSCKQLKSITDFYAYAAKEGKNTRRRYCYECEKKRVNVRAQTPHERWMHSKRRSAKSGQIWEISFEIFKKLISEKCHYCGGKLNLTGCGLDRKDNNEGYIEQNVVSCCRQCNTVKNYFFTYEEMMLLSPILRQIRSKQNADRK